jgi:hypothetical protein
MAVDAAATKSATLNAAVLAPMPSAANEDRSDRKARPRESVRAVKRMLGISSSTPPVNRKRFSRMFGRPMQLIARFFRSTFGASVVLRPVLHLVTSLGDEVLDPRIEHCLELVVGIPMRVLGRLSAIRNSRCTPARMSR